MFLWWQPLPLFWGESLGGGTRHMFCLVALVYRIFISFSLCSLETPKSLISPLSWDIRELSPHVLQMKKIKTLFDETVERSAKPSFCSSVFDWIFLAASFLPATLLSKSQLWQNVFRISWIANISPIMILDRIIRLFVMFIFCKRKHFNLFKQISVVVYWWYKITIVSATWDLKLSPEFQRASKCDKYDLSEEGDH